MIVRVGRDHCPRDFFKRIIFLHVEFIQDRIRDLSLVERVGLIIIAHLVMWPVGTNLGTCSVILCDDITVLIRFKYRTARLVGSRGRAR